MRRIAAASSALLCLLLSTHCAKDIHPERTLPRPTEITDMEELEERGEARREWIARMHRAPPDVDWRAIERENGRREMERRNQLVNQMKSQGGPLALTVSGVWSEVGSKNQAGRTHCAVLSPDGQSTYVGTSLGGVWKGSTTGTGWVPLADNLFGGVHEIVTWAGASGQPDVVLAVRDDGAVHRSTDGGVTWTVPSGLGGVFAIRGIGKLADAAQTCVLYGRVGSQSAIFASTNQGQSFTKRWFDTSSHDGYLFVPRKGSLATATLYMVHRGRLYRSTDAGVTFPTVTTINTSATQGMLAGSEAGLPTLYAALQVGGTWTLHRSDNGGGSFVVASASLSDFWGEMRASTVNPNLVMFGGVECWKSTDGGANFAKINSWGSYYSAPATKLHADMMGIHCWPNPANPNAEIWFINSDGGTYRSDNQGANVSNLCLSGLGIGQYYSTLTSKTNPALIHVGAQDQGYQWGTVAAPLPGGGPSTNMTQEISGDYGHLTSGDGTTALVYSTYPGFILVVANASNPSVLATLDFPAGSNSDWLPAVVAEPGNNNVFYFLGNKLWKYTRVGTSTTWNITEHSTFDFGASGGNYLTALAFSPVDANRVYAVNEAGRLYYSTNHGVTWTQGTGSAPGQQYFYGNALAAHPTDALTAVVGGSGYGNPGVLRTTNGGQTWASFSTGLPQTLVYGLAYATDGSGDIYAATEAGAYRYNATAATWENIMLPGTPLTTYWSVEWVAATNTARFGTYGRGVWDFTTGDPGPGPCNGTITAVGTACAGSGGFVPELAMTGCAGPNQTLNVSITKGLGGQTALVFLGFLPVPTMLPGGCPLYPYPILPFQISLPLLGSGAGNGAIAISTTLPATAAGNLVVQALIPDPGVNKGYSSTNAVTLFIQ